MAQSSRSTAAATPRGRAVIGGLHAGLLFAVVGVLAVVTGQPAIFPSLGPTAYVLAVEHGGPKVATRRVVGGHVVGVVVGLLAYHLLAPGVVLTGGLAPLSTSSIRLAASGVVSVALTSWAMLAADAVHPPACATTLIVSLGLLSAPWQAAVVVGSVVVLFESHQLLEGVAPRLVDALLD